MPLSAMFSASMRGSSQRRYCGTSISVRKCQFVAMAGSSSCSTTPDSAMARYSSFIASAIAKMKSSCVA